MSKGIASDGWTLGTLKEHFDDLRKADQEAVKVLASNFEQRMSTTNEWRGALEDQAKSKATIQQFETLKERMDKVELTQAATGGNRAGAGQLIIIAGVIIGSVAAINGIIFVIQGAGH